MACQVPGRPKGGACRLSQAALVTITAGSACARGPMVEVAAPSGAGPSGPAGQSASSAPLRFQGRCGVPRRWGRSGQRSVSDRGEGFPPSGIAIPMSSSATASTDALQTMDVDAMAEILAAAAMSRLPLIDEFLCPLLTGYDYRATWIAWIMELGPIRHSRPPGWSG